MVTWDVPTTGLTGGLQRTGTILANGRGCRSGTLARLNDVFLAALSASPFGQLDSAERLRAAMGLSRLPPMYPPASFTDYSGSRAGADLTNCSGTALISDCRISRAASSALLPGS